MAVVLTEQHLTPPINYCSVAMACIHDSRPVCASTPDGCSRRNFLDQCDMFEYNCDYGAEYTTSPTSLCERGPGDFSC
ncbi:unnamed protein product [Parnassius mnemosyne]|uniref:Kazal-like domain-containing protein n=1 Tax=Parnassius mnemosyne TaxID=213953 RepID=A0AAV1LE66_9NEOP